MVLLDEWFGQLCHVFNGERNHSQKEVGLELAAAGWVGRCREGERQRLLRCAVVWGHCMSSAEVLGRHQHLPGTGQIRIRSWLGVWSAPDQIRAKGPAL